MIKKKNRAEAARPGKEKSGQHRAAGIRSGLFVLSAVMAALIAAAGFGRLQAHAGSADQKTETVVIRTSSDDEFASKSSELAKYSRGMMIQSTGEAKPYSSGRLIVSVKEGKKVDFSKYSATTVIESNFGVSIVQFSSGSAAEKAAKKIAALSAVSYVEPDDCSVNIDDTIVEDISPEENSTEEIGDLSGQSTADDLGDLQNGDSTGVDSGDPVYENSLQTEASSTSSNAMSWGAAYIQADKYAAFVKANTKRSIKVAVVDSGVSSHSKLKGRILTGKDYIDNDNNPSDKNGHGTHVAGVIVDCTPGINVKILPVRVMNASGVGSPSVVGNGIRYAVNNGAKVVNLSLGSYYHYKYIEECITYAHNKGVTVVIAAGNECLNTRDICPAHMKTPIVVGAINKSGKRAYFSNYGSSLDITAPGVDIKSCWLNGKYATASGTSMACPHISAVAAMYRLMNPSAKPSRIEYLVRCYAKDLGSKGTDNYYGRGVPRMAGSITPSSVSLSKTKASVQVKKTLTLKAKITPSYAGKNKLTWSSSNNKVVTVNSGKLTAKGKGTAVITVKTVNGKKATCKVTVTSGSVKTSSVGKIDEERGAAPPTMEEAPPASAQKSSAKKTSASVPAQTKDPVKMYVYPSEKAGNAQVQDGSIVEGSRLALEAEIVPAREETPVLFWTSSDPDIASVDENGVVTAVAAGKAKISAVLSTGEDSSPASAEQTAAAGQDVSADDSVVSGQMTPAGDGSTGGEETSAESTTTGEDAAPAGVTGTYTVTVVKPSVLTRHASYKAGYDEEVKIETVVRLPASLSDDSSGEDAERINPPADYVLAILYDDGDSAVLLGAVDLGGYDSGKVHVHDSGTGKKREDITKVTGADTPDRASDPILTDMASGKKASETGILYMCSEKADGSKADLSLAVDIEALRAAVGAGPSRTETLSNCRLAVYTDMAFEEREDAAEQKDREKIRGIDENAVCKCSFSLSYDVPAQEEEAAQTTDPDAVNEAEPQTGTGEDSSADSGTGKSGNDIDDTDDTTDTSEDSGSETDDTDSAPQDQETGEDTPDDSAAADSGASEYTGENADESGSEEVTDDTDVLPVEESVEEDEEDEQDSGSAEDSSTGSTPVQTSSEDEVQEVREDDAQQIESPKEGQQTEEAAVEGKSSRPEEQVPSEEKTDGAVSEDNEAKE